MEIISTTTNGLRRPKWQPPTPRIIQIPRLHRKRSSQTKATTPTKPMLQKDNNNNKLGALFHKERIFKVEEQRRERVEEENGSGDGLVMMVEELEKWKFQNEMLRAECNLLRMEKDIAVKKMERRRIVCLEKGFKFAVQSMLSGRKKICDGHNPSLVFEEEIQELIEKLEKLQKRSRVKQLDFKKCSNFDKKALSLQKHLEKFDRLDNDVCVKEIQEFAEATNDSFHFNESFVPISNGNNVEILRRKMEGLSKGDLLERMEEEYESMLATASNSATNSASSSKRIEYCDPFLPKEKIANVCSGRCKAIVRRIVEQVRVETEQWSQMQEMLGQVREEMEELQISRIFWEDRALDSDHQIQALRSAVQEWKRKALNAESKSNHQQSQLSTLSTELQILKKEQARDKTRAKASSPAPPQDSSNEMEKRVLVCRVKENYQTNDYTKRKQDILNDRRRKVHICNALKRVPIGEIGNL